MMPVSGHGDQVKCAPWDKTEADGLDEAIIPCDATDNESSAWIIDNACYLLFSMDSHSLFIKEMRELLVRKVPVGSQLTVCVFYQVVPS